jgi:hypothetical protein
LEYEAETDPEADEDGKMVVVAELDDEDEITVEAEELVIMAVDGDEVVVAALYVVEETPEEPVTSEPEM